MSKILLDDVTTNLDGPSVPCTNFNHVEYGLAQVYINGTGTVAVQGRVTSDMPWTTIVSTTVSGAFRITPFPWIRAVTSGVIGTIRSEFEY